MNPIAAIVAGLLALLAIKVALTPVRAKASAAMSKDEFAALALEAIRATGDTREHVYDAAEFCLRIRDIDSTFYLNNLFQEMQGKPREKCHDFLKRYWEEMRSREKVESSFDEARAILLPVLRPTTYDHSIKVAVGIDKPFPPQVRVPITTCHRLGLALDYKMSLAEVRLEQLQKWNVTLEEALEAARANLKKLTSAPFAQVSPGVFRSPFNDCYDAARLWLTDVVRALPVKGQPVAFAPERNHLYVTGSEDAEGLHAAAKLAQAALQSPRWISGLAVLLTDDGWREFLPPPEHPAFGILKELQVETRVREYTELKTYLEADHKRTGRDVFVAKAAGWKNPKTGGAHTISTWTRDVPTFLPRTDSVALVDTSLPKERAVRAIVPWDALQAIAAQRMTPQGLTPDYHFVETFPTEEELAAIQAAAPRT